MAGDVLKDLESYVPQIRDLAGELNGVTSTLKGIGSQAAQAAGQMRDLYNPANYGGFEKLTKDAQAFTLNMTKFGPSVTMENFKDQLHQVEEGFRLMQKQGLQQMGILGKGLETTFRRMEATGKGFWRSLAREAVISVKAMASEIFSLKNIFNLGMSVITASLGIVYKSINYVIDACKKAWQITVDWMNNLYAAAGSVAQSLGLSGKAVGQLRGQIESLYIAESNLADNMGDIATAASAVMTAFRDQSPVTKLVDDIFLMGKAMGISTEGAAKLIFYFDRAWGIKGQKERRLFVSEQLDFANKIGVPHKEMMETLETQMDLTSRLGKDGVVAIHRLTAASKAFGISQEKIVTNMAKFDTLEETIPTINKINMLTGAAIDPFLVFAENDPTKKFTYIMENIRRSVGDWKEMDRLTKLSLANITGFSESEMEKAFSAGNMQKVVDDLVKKGEAGKKTTEAWNDAVMAAKSFFVSFDRLFRPLFSQISKTFMGLAPTFIEALKNVLTGFSSLIKSFTGKDQALNLLLYGEEKQGGGFTDAISNWSIKLKEILMDRGFQMRVSDFINNVRDVFTKAVAWIDKLIEALKKRLPGMMDGFNAFFKTVVDRVQNMLEKIEEYKVLDTLEKAAKTVINLIKFIDQNKGMLLGVLGAFKLAGAVGGFQQAYGSIYGLKNIANANIASNVIGKSGFADQAAVDTYIRNMGGDPNRFYKVRGSNGYEVEGFNDKYRPSWGERAYASSQQKFGATTRMGFGLGLGTSVAVAGIPLAMKVASGEKIGGKDIGGAVGGLALGAVGALLGPMGAMVGSMIGNVAGKWIGNKLDKNAQITEAQNKISDELNKKLEKISESKIRSEKKFNDSILGFTKNIDKTKESIAKLYSASNFLQEAWIYKSGSEGMIDLDYRSYADRIPHLQELFDKKVITEQEFKDLSDPTGPVKMTSVRFNELIGKLERYNVLESIRIRLMEKDPEIVKELGEKRKKEAKSEIAKREIGNLWSALNNWSKGKGAYFPTLQKGIARDIVDPRTLEFFNSQKGQGLMPELLTGQFQNTRQLEAFFRSKDIAAPSENVLTDIASMNKSIFSQQEIIDTNVNNNLAELQTAMTKSRETMDDLDTVLSDFPEKNTTEIINGQRKLLEEQRDMFKRGDKQEIDKSNAVQAGINKFISVGNIKSVIEQNPELMSKFIGSLGSQKDMIGFLSNIVNMPGISLDENERSAYSELEKTWTTPSEEFADGGPIKTNTVLSTVTSAGRLRPYATAGEPGNPESVVPNRKLAQNINLNLTVPVSIDGKKITDVVIQRLIPLDV